MGVTEYDYRSPSDPKPGQRPPAKKKEEELQDSDPMFTDPPPSKTGGGGGSGRGAPASGRPQQNTRTIYNQLRQQFPFDISRYIEETIRLGESSDYLYARILQSPEFKASFPGIFRPDGTLRYSPGEYMELRDRFSSTAAQYGFALSQQQLGGLISRGVTSQDFEINAKGIQQAKMNPDLVKRLNEQIQDRNANLIRQGKMPIPEIKNFTDAVDFFAGRASQEVYDLYEAASFATVAGELAKEGILEGFSNLKARELAAGTAGVLDVDEIREGMVRLAQMVREGGVDLAEAGLDEDQLLTLEFGGKDQAVYATRAGQAIRQARAKAEAQQASSFIEYEAGRPKVQERQEASL